MTLCRWCFQTPTQTSLCDNCYNTTTDLLRRSLDCLNLINDEIGKQTSKASLGGGSEPGVPAPISLDALGAKDELKAVLVRLCVRARLPGYDPRLLWVNASRLRALFMGAGTDPLQGLCQALEDAVSKCERVIDTRTERVPYGDCAECGQRIIAPVGVQFVRCPNGHATTAAEAHQTRTERILDAVGSEHLPVARIVDALILLGFPDITRSIIENWISRGKLTRHNGIVSVADALDLAEARRDKKRKTKTGKR